jgi:hypothetical protein
MHQAIGRTLSSFELGEAQVHANMGVVPILLAGNGLEYLTMKEALEAGLLQITEVSEGGNVPNLKAVNKADKPVLLLDGEEVAGAKQNRVLNTTILVKEKSEVVIPVSCTEQGRWSYASREFHESGNVMVRHMRAGKAASVSLSYESVREARSDQGRIWNEIHDMSREAGAPSQTGAMRDVFEQRKDELDDYLKAFHLVPGQKGLIVIMDGQVAGFDSLSLERAFGILFPKLVKSYAMEAWMASRRGKTTPLTGENAVGLAKGFLAQAASCEEKVYASAGMGQDFRYSGPGLVGSALLVDETVVHAAFFRITGDEQVGNMAGMGRRRSFRV